MQLFDCLVFFFYFFISPSGNQILVWRPKTSTKFSKHEGSWIILMEIYHNALFKHILLWAPAALVIFKSSQQAVETLIPFVTVHMSNWQSAHSVRQGEKKNLFNVCPTRRHEVWLAESREWLLIMCPNKQFQLLSLLLNSSTLPIQTEVTGHGTTLWL